jgi:hypothetical protein
MVARFGINIVAHFHAPYHCGVYRVVLRLVYCQHGTISADHRAARIAGRTLYGERCAAQLTQTEGIRIECAICALIHGIQPSTDAIASRMYSLW